VQDINKINEIQAVPKIEPIQISQSHLELHSTNKKGKLLIRNRNMPDVREIKDFKSYEQSLQDKINQTIVEPKRVEAIDTPTDTLPIINESMQKKKKIHIKTSLKQSDIPDTIPIEPEKQEIKQKNNNTFKTTLN